MKLRQTSPGSSPLFSGHIIGKIAFWRILEWFFLSSPGGSIGRSSCGTLSESMIDLEEGKNLKAHRSWWHQISWFRVRFPIQCQFVGSSSCVLPCQVIVLFFPGCLSFLGQCSSCDLSSLTHLRGALRF